MVLVGGVRRPTSIEEIARLMSACDREASIQQGLAFQPRPTDVLISPFPKCGTTWTQQIVHGLRTRGSMEFDEITAVVPWLEMAGFMGIDLDAPQPHPRAFKSHMSWHKIPKGGRYIYVVRNPGDALLSFYRFFEGWWFETGSISITEFFEGWFVPGDYWSHLASWWDQHENNNVLILCFETMKENPVAAIRLIARFLDIALDNELLEIVTRQSSFEFMKAHQHQFDEHLMNEAFQRACGLPPGGDSSKVRKGRVGDHRHELPAEVLASLDHYWREKIEHRYGLRGYDDLRVAIARLHG